MLFTDWRTFALGSAVFAALTAIFGKIGVENINSNLATWIRTIVILLVIGFIVSFRREWQTLDSISARNWIFLIISGVCTGLSWLCYYRALQLGPASRVAPIDKMSILFVILFAYFFLQEGISWKVAMGSLLIAAGSVLIAL